jgi:16S rRNA processing protein RimM
LKSWNNPVDATGFVAIAKIIKPQGNRGEVAAEIWTDFPERFQFVKDVLLQRSQQQPQSLRVESFWFHKKRVILKFFGVDNRSMAEELRDYEVMIPESQRMPLTEGTYYQHELLNCVVKDRQGRSLGKISEVVGTEGNYLLKVSRDTGDFLIPFAQSLLVQASVKDKELVCDLPEGLEDL